ncbi:MAG: metallophosphoesterase, partial [Planctomycetota bacterium]|nr:metallophosphoesterase [Planctomycetota bacterium]
TGTSRGVRAAAAVFDRLPCPWLAAVGNHDLQATEEFDTDEANLADFLAAVRRSSPWASLESNGIFFVVLGSQMWRGNVPQPHEVRLLEDQLTWFRETLAARPAMPTVVVTHAPILGSGLRILPSVHGLAGNAWVNHCHDPGALAEIRADNPQIIMWLSGHSHLGHDYPDALSERRGTLFVHVGVPTAAASRDGMRHSRVIDFEDGDIKVWTYDHAAGQLRGKPDWTAGTPVWKMPARTCVFLPEAVREGTAPGLSITEDGRAVEVADLPILNFLPRHEAPVSALAWAPDGRLLVGTDGGTVWEYAPGAETPSGILWEAPAPIRCLAVRPCGDRALWAADISGAVIRADLSDPDRFVHSPAGRRRKPPLGIAPAPVARFRFPECVGVTFVEAGDGRAWMIDSESGCFREVPGKGPPGRGIGLAGDMARSLGGLTTGAPAEERLAAGTIAFSEDGKSLRCVLDAGGKRVEIRRVLRRAARVAASAAQGETIAIAPGIPGDRDYPVLVLAARAAPAKVRLVLEGTVASPAGGERRAARRMMEIRRGDPPISIVRFPEGDGG